MVTVFGVGAVLGAVYIAEFVDLLAPATCEMMVERVPQDEPLQPAPVKAQVIASLGFDPGTGVKVATIAAVPSVGTLAGALTVSVKLLVTVMDAEARLEGSAALCAVKVTLEGEGRICGAVKFPRASTTPHPLEHAVPETLQRTVVSGCPALVMLALNAWSAPSSTLATFGVMFTTMSLVMENVALSDFVGSATLVAVTCTLAGDGRSPGAVYTPEAEIVPDAALPPFTPLTLQVTAVLLVLVTDALNVWLSPSKTMPFFGETLT
jgi:hypothetical protein